MTDALDNPVDVVTEFATYEEYLDSHITSEDLFYLEVRVMARLPPCVHDRTRSWRVSLSSWVSFATLISLPTASRLQGKL